MALPGWQPVRNRWLPDAHSWSVLGPLLPLNGCFACDADFSRAWLSVESSTATKAWTVFFGVWLCALVHSGAVVSRREVLL
jgi:hypothetical protein